MKKLVALTMTLLLLTGPLITVLAEEETSSGQVITGDNYKVTVPEDLRVIDSERLAELGQKSMNAIDIYLEENPEDKASVEAGIAELKEKGAENSALIEEKTGVDFQGVKDSSIEQGKKNAELHKKFQFELRGAIEMEIVGMEYTAFTSWSSDLSQLEEVTSKYSDEEIKELNYIDFSEDEVASFTDSTESAIAAWSSVPGYAETEIISSEVVVLPTNDNVEVVKTTYQTTPVFEKGNSRAIVSYSTVVSGKFFVMQYSEKGDAEAVETAAEGIFNTLTFTEVDRKDILGMEPDVFRKAAFLAVVAVVILIIVLLVVKNSKKKKAAMQEQQANFEDVQYGGQNAYQEQNSLGTNQNQEMNQYQNQEMNQYQNQEMNQYQNQGTNEYQNHGMNEYQNQGMNEYQNQGMNEYQNQGMNDQQFENAGQNPVAEETQLTDEVQVEETEVTLESQEDEVKPTE